jgi:hypothetical protein
MVLETAEHECTHLSRLAAEPASAGDCVATGLVTPSNSTSPSSRPSLPPQAHWHLCLPASDTPPPPAQHIILLPHNCTDAYTCLLCTSGHVILHPTFLRLPDASAPSESRVLCPQRSPPPNTVDQLLVLSLGIPLRISKSGRVIGFKCFIASVSY